MFASAWCLLAGVKQNKPRNYEASLSIWQPIRGFDLSLRKNGPTRGPCGKLLERF